MQLLFKEAYWLIACLTNIADTACSERMTTVSQFIQSKLRESSVNQVNKQFVPEEKDRNTIIALAKSIVVNSEWMNIISDFAFEEKNKKYNIAGSIIVRIKIDEDLLKSNGISRKEIRPNILQQLVFLVWNKLIGEMSDCFLFDQTTIPYFISVCSGYTDPSNKIVWNRESVKQHAEELGQWAEIYSGQYSEYRDDVYIRRLEGDLSNRESEIHILNKNSALIYMEPENYNLYFKKDVETPNSTGYMYETLLKTIARIRVILYSMLLINKSIDEDTKTLSQKSYEQKELNTIKEDLEKSKRMKNELQGVLAPIFTDLTRSYRQHYTAVLTRLMELFEVEKNWERILKKVELNTTSLNSIYLDKQEESQKRQETILNMVNFILGSSIIFEIVGYIVRDNETVNTINSIIGIGFIVILAMMLIKIFMKKEEK